MRLLPIRGTTIKTLDVIRKRWNRSTGVAYTTMCLRITPHTLADDVRLFLEKRKVYVAHTIICEICWVRTAQYCCYPQALSKLDAQWRPNFGVTRRGYRRENISVTRESNVVITRERVDFPITRLLASLDQQPAAVTIFPTHNIRLHFARSLYYILYYTVNAFSRLIALWRTAL